MSLKFYDTNALLNLLDKAFEEKFVISSKSLQEIENIKVSDRKDPEVKYRARQLTRLLNKHEDMYTVAIQTREEANLLDELELEISPDNIIMASACLYNRDIEPIVFVTDDICCKLIAKNVFALNVESVKDDNKDEYKGYKEKVISDNTELAYLYEHLNENTYNLLVNEYLIIKNTDGEVIDKFRWNGDELIPVKHINLKSKYFGTIKAYKNDIYQQCALDALSYSQVTMLKGKAGSGKSYLALGYLFSLLDKNKIDKIIVFCNTVPTGSSARLGFYPGTRSEKLLESSIGNMLSAKLGGTIAVEQLIEEEKLVLMPMCDIRGYDTTSDSKVGVYISEAQNMDIYLMKLALQRIGENAICIIDGDYANQTDSPQYAGSNNGMRRASEVFRGQDFYGEIELQNIYRSKIAKIAELM